MTEDIQLWLGDCLELMGNIPDNSIDMILADLPYGTTACKWDVIIPFEPLWKQYERIIKKNGAIVLMSSQPFTTLLISSNLAMYKYSWIWEKDNASNFFAAKFQPLNNTEDVNVFSFGGVNTGAKNPVVYFPQGIKNIKIEHINGKNVGGLLGKEQKIAMQEGRKYIQERTGYPFKTLKYKRDSKKTHPTQKPVSLMEYLIKTYTLEGELVLDNTMGVGSTMVACKNTNRRGIGIEKEKKYYDIAIERLR